MSVLDRLPLPCQGGAACLLCQSEGLWRWFSLWAEITYSWFKKRIIPSLPASSVLLGPRGFFSQRDICLFCLCHGILSMKSHRKIACYWTRVICSFLAGQSEGDAKSPGEAGCALLSSLSPVEDVWTQSSPGSAQPHGWLTFLEPWGEAGAFPWLQLASMDTWDNAAAALGWAGVQVAAGWGKSSVGWVVLSLSCWASASGSPALTKRHPSLSNGTSSFLAKGKKAKRGNNLELHILVVWSVFGSEETK